MWLQNITRKNVHCSYVCSFGQKVEPVGQTISNDRHVTILPVNSTKVGCNDLRVSWHTLPAIDPETKDRVECKGICGEKKVWNADINLYMLLKLKLN